MGVDYTPNAGHGYKLKRTEQAKEENKTLLEVMDEDKEIEAVIRCWWDDDTKDRDFEHITDGHECYTGDPNDHFLVLADRNLGASDEGLKHKLFVFIYNHPLIQVDPDQPEFQHWITLQVH